MYHVRGDGVKVSTQHNLQIIPYGSHTSKKFRTKCNAMGCNLDANFINTTGLCISCYVSYRKGKKSNTEFELNRKDSKVESKFK